MTKSRRTAAPGGSGGEGFTAEERAAMRERVKEQRAGKAADPDAEVRAKIAELTGEDRDLAERVHAAVRAAAPQLTPKLWYGMPAYARQGKVVCFFQAAGKFKARYATLGFGDAAALDDGAMWPTAFALRDWTDAVEERVRALVRQAAG
ncbi:iron chaperone [Deinococcus ficus]|uniref:Uncharacterized protein n=1 Tax=Deinococcus ficus TaxID=317577 RepID=A0A221SZD1_9DEIO|nr:DUF1801 domain-containing protein [Deinococcus ficus]ASN81970.1 hypothetical protein DFI_03135 [Deinococcus ficus]